MNAHAATLSANARLALDLAARGLPVFPCRPDNKRPKVEHGFKAASADAGEVRGWWARWPDALVGLPTGEASGLYVVDLDVDKDTGEPVGEATWRALGLADLLAGAVATPSGGRHLYFRDPGPAFRNTAKSRLGPGIDTRGEGGYVIAPGSVAPGGAYAAPAGFAWGTFPELPLSIRALLSRREREGAAPNGSRPDAGRASAWAEAALRDELGRVATAAEGGRNHALNRAAFALGQIVGGGGLDEHATRGRLIGAARAAGLPQGEAEATVASGMGAGMREPRTAPERPQDGRERARAGEDAHPGSSPVGEPDDADGFDLSHDALACDLGARSWDMDARHVAAWGQWLFWDGTRWAKDAALEHLTRARGFVNERAVELIAWAEHKAKAASEAEAAKLRAWAKGEARTLRHASTVAAVMSLARSNRASAARPDDFDADPMLLGTPGGTVDLATGELRPARREDAITRLTAVAPASGPPRRWLAFLDEAFAGDRELVAFMQRAAGYSLTGLTVEHRLLFPYGGGANGKSTFLEALARLWGDYARRIPAVSLLNGQGERHPTDLAGLRGARLVVGSELPRGKSWDESALKDLTGGDTVTARFMRGDFFDFRPQFTLWIAGNTLPAFKGVDEALRRRVVLLPFNVTIPPERRDPDLPRKLDAEAGQILAWAIEGAVEWQRRGLDVPASVAAASMDYLDGEDTLGQFLADETVEAPGAFVTTTALHERFRQWCERQGLTSPWSVNTFSKELRGRGIEDRRTMHGRGFVGLRLAP